MSSVLLINIMERIRYESRRLEGLQPRKRPCDAPDERSSGQESPLFRKEEVSSLKPPSLS